MSSCRTRSWMFAAAAVTVFLLDTVLFAEAKVKTNKQINIKNNRLILGYDAAEEWMKTQKVQPK